LPIWLWLFLRRRRVLDGFAYFPHINTRLVHMSRVVGRYRHGD
jgi:hypothetical protein